MNNNNTTRRDTMHCVSTAPTFLAIIFALTFTLFACSDDSDDDDTTGGTSSGLEESSSSSGGNSSSSSEVPESSSSSSDKPVDSSSSSDDSQSSSSGGDSLSSSSGGDNISSSSSELSSSSSSESVSSSSVKVSSSSSVKQSSSSTGCTAKNNTDTHYCSDGTLKQYGTFEYEGKTYKTVEIGTQTWMAKNLDIAPTSDNDAKNSWCYNETPANCEKYGRLYDWATAMALPEECNTTLSENDPDCAIDSDGKHQGLCPEGYHIPTIEDWSVLLKYVDTENNGVGDNAIPYYSQTADKYLKAESGWNNCGSKCLDTYGFSALPGGNRIGLSFGDAGNYGYWWGSNEHNSNGAQAHYRNMENVHDGVHWSLAYKSYGISVRCVKDN